MRIADRCRGLDRALLRRCVAALRLRALDHAGAVRAFRHLLGHEPPGVLPDDLKIGDTVAVRHRREVLDGDADPRTLVEWLAERAQVGGPAPRVIGFSGHRAEGAVAAGEGRGAARVRSA